MRLINAFTAAAEKRDHFLAEYGGRVKDSFAKTLKDLGPRPSADDVDRVFATTSGFTANWRVSRTFPCHECGEYFDEVVEVGQEPDYESATANMCSGCLIKALQLLDGD